MGCELLPEVGQTPAEGQVPQVLIEYGQPFTGAEIMRLGLLGIKENPFERLELKPSGFMTSTVLGPQSSDGVVQDNEVGEGFGDGDGDGDGDRDGVGDGEEMTQGEPLKGLLEGKNQTWL